MYYLFFLFTRWLVYVDPLTLTLTHIQLHLYPRIPPPSGFSQLIHIQSHIRIIWESDDCPLHLTKSSEWFLKDQAFQPSYDQAPRPTLSPSPVSKLSSVLMGEGGGGGGGAKSYNAL